MRHRPLLTFVLGFISGIAGAHLFSIGIVLPIVVAALGAAWLLISTKRWVAAAAGIAMIGFCAGALRYQDDRAIPPSDISLLARAPQQTLLTGIIVSDPQAVHRTVTFTLRAETAQIGFRRQSVSGQAAVIGRVVPRGVLEYGDIVTVDGTLQGLPQASAHDGYSRRDYLARKSIYCEIVARTPITRQSPGLAADAPARIAYALRRAFVRAIDNSLTADRAPVLAGILFGAREDIPSSTNDLFIETGTVHILATAGLHVGIIAFWLFTMLRAMTMPRKGALVLAVLMLWLFAFLAGDRPAVLRAVTMASVYLGALIFEREPDPWTSLAAAALILLLVAPASLLDPGFQLSFLTVITLAITLPAWNGLCETKLHRLRDRRLRKPAIWIADLIGLSVFAQIGSAPIVAYTYHQVSLTGPIANLFVVPCLFIVIPLGLAGAVIGSVWPAAGLPFLTVAGWIVGAILWIVQRAAAAPSSFIPVESPPPALIALSYGALWSAAAWLNRRFPRQEAARENRIAD